MRLGLHTDYALRTLIYLAGRPGRASVAEVAGFYAISKDHVAKVVQSLARHGYVRSIRGAGGGIELARRPEEIRIGQVVLEFEGNLHLLECVGVENVCIIQPGCKLRSVLAEAERRQVDYLNSVRLSDIVRPGGQLLEIMGPGEKGKERGKSGQNAVGGGRELGAGSWKRAVTKQRVDGGRRGDRQ
jgi:Rrf2 family transcriptional regulator, nitric oxide-sensitive transcriptional repressor